MYIVFYFLGFGLESFKIILIIIIIIIIINYSYMYVSAFPIS
jgi:hypothetical protein